MSGPKPRRPRAGLDRLVGELEGAGEVVAEGGFTLDRDRAKEKVRDFALEDPNRYVLLLVQAAAAKGASRVGFEIDSDDMRIRFDGEPFTARDLDQLYAEMFSERPDDHAFACRELALGLLGAMATDPAWVKVESGDGESGARLYMQPGQADRIEAAPGVVAGTSIHVKSRLGFRTLARFGRDVLGALPEEARIQEHCRRAPYEVSIDGRRVSEGMPTDVLAPTTHRARGIEIFAGFRPSTEPASLEILCRGVWVTTHALPDLPPQLVVIADVAALHRDITQFEVVRDAAYERLLHEVHAAYEAALAELVRIVSRDIADARSEEIPAPASALEAALPAWLRAYLEGELVRRTRTARGQGGPGLSRKLWSLRLFRTIAGRSISARELERSNPVVIAPSPPGELDAVEFPDAIALQDPSTRATLDTIFGTKVRDLAEARTRGEIRADRKSVV